VKPAAPAKPAASAKPAAARPSEPTLPGSRLFAGASEESLMIDLEEPNSLDECTDLTAGQSEERELTVMVDGAAESGAGAVESGAGAVRSEADADEPEIDVEF
jgi:3-oxoacyl-ACP reductase-like protein